MTGLDGTARVTTGATGATGASADGMRIGEAARLSGVPAKTIRFYEAEGVVPRPARNASGYRAYGPNDVRRLRLLGRLRALGLSLDEAGGVAAQAFGGECRVYVDDLSALLRRRCEEIDQRIAALVALRAELATLADRAGMAIRTARAGLRVEDCGDCPVVDDEAVNAESVAFADCAPRCGPTRTPRGQVAAAYSRR
jgi:MerR family transcriptional regulator, copper efflux regulator